MKWVDAATAPDQMTAEMWCDILRNEGIPASFRQLGLPVHLGPLATPCKVMVPEERLADALAVLEGMDVHPGEDEDGGGR